MSTLPSIFGYDLIHHVGGPESLVFRAREWDTAEDVAVKFARQDVTDSAGRLLLAREAQAGFAVRHPHLVHIRHAQLSQQPYFLALDLLPGLSLATILQRENALEMGAAVQVARQIAEALAALHRAGFVHRDVKPENVQWVNSETAVLLDLGFAHRRGNELLGQQGAILGTPNYLAPERCDPSFPAEDKCDIFGLGVMLFEMLTGELPYPSGNVDRTLEIHRQSVAADLRDFPGAWPWDLVRLLHRMLAFRPADRPPASILAQELMELEVEGLVNCNWH
jgi:serine/threonine-protein kinase